MTANTSYSRLVYSKRGAFTLIEIVLVLVIISILTAGVITIINKTELVNDAKRIAAKGDIQTIESALLLHEASTGRLPTTNQGLGLLVEQGRLRRMPKDPFQRDYEYQTGGERSGLTHDVWSRFEKLEDPTDDVGNWETEQDNG